DPGPRIAELREGLMPPHLALANERQRMLRIGRLELPGEPMPVENCVEDLPRRMTVADTIDGLQSVLVPLGAARPELRIQLAVRHARSHEHERITIEMHEGVAAAASPAAGLHLIEPGAVAVQIKECQPSRLEGARPVIGEV